MFKKKVKLRAVTINKSAYELFPLSLAKDSKPSWLKSMPSFIDIKQCPFKSVLNKIATASTCYGIRELTSKGLIVRAWRDMSIVIYPDGGVSFAGAGLGDTNPEMMPLNANTHPNLYSGKVLFKLYNPWHFYGDGTQYIQIPAQYHSDFTIENHCPIGVIEFKYQHNATIFFAADIKDEPYEIYIKAGTPLIHLIPLSEKALSLSVEFDEKESIINLPFFVGRYVKTRRAIDVAERNSK